VYEGMKEGEENEQEKGRKEEGNTRERGRRDGVRKKRRKKRRTDHKVFVGASLCQFRASAMLFLVVGNSNYNFEMGMNGIISKQSFVKIGQEF
jgi:hypothetical protein